MDKGRLPIAIFTRDETEGTMARDACQYQYSQGMRVIKIEGIMDKGRLPISIFTRDETEGTMTRDACQ